MAFAPDPDPVTAMYRAGNDVPARALHGLLHERARTLFRMVDRIRDEIDERQQLSDRVLRQIDQDRCDVSSQLLALEQRPVFTHAAVDARRATLEHRLASLAHERRREHVEAWRDTAMLTRELRSWLKQAADYTQRLQLLTPRGGTTP